MSRWSRDPEAVDRDLVIAFAHPEFREMRAIDALQEVKRRRGEFA